MPTYEYECLGCGSRFEIFQSIKEKPKRKCPECKNKIKRLIGSGGGIIFKGSGFYATDYRSSEYHKKAKQETQKKENKKDKSDKKDKSK